MKKAVTTFLLLTAFSYIYGNQTINIMQGTEEIWKDVVGYEGLYKISNQGRVISLPKQRGRYKGYLTKERFLNFHPDYDGYLIALLSKDSKGKKHKVHRLVAQHFIPNPENKPQVNHLKGIKTDNRATELAWATSGENMRHAHKTGLASMDHLIALSRTKKRHLNPNSKEIHQYSLDGVFIKTWLCLLDAVDFYNHGVRSAASGRQKTSAGFIWSYKKLHDDTNG